MPLRRASKVTPDMRELQWRMRRYDALKRIMANKILYGMRTELEISDYIRADREAKELNVEIGKGVKTRIPYSYVQDVISAAVDAVFGGQIPAGVSIKQRDLRLSRWLREQNVPVPSKSSFSKYFLKTNN